MTTNYQKPYRVEAVTEGGYRFTQDRCTRESAEETYHRIARHNADVRLIAVKGDHTEIIKEVIA